MSEVLDLKDVQPGATTEVPEAPVESAVNSESIEELAEAALARATLSTAVAWTAHHPLDGASRRRHYLLSAGIVGFAGLISIWQGNPSAFIVVLLGVGVLGLRQHLSKPMSVSVNGQGLEVDGQRYDHATFASFHIHRMPDDTLELSLKSGKRFFPHIRLPLGEQDPHELHAVLMQYIPEGVHKIPLMDYYVRKPR